MRMPNEALYANLYTFIMRIQNALHLGCQWLAWLPLPPQMGLPIGIKLTRLRWLGLGIRTIRPASSTADLSLYILPL